MQRATSWPLLSKQPPVFTGVAGGRYHLINTLPLWKEFFAELVTKPVTANDLETSGLNPFQHEIIGFVFSWGAANSYYVPIGHRTNEKQLHFEDIKDDLLAFYSDPNRTTVWHNSKFDLHFLLKVGIVPKGIVFCTRLMHRLIDETSSTALKKIAVTEVHPDANKWEKDIDEFRAAYGRKYKIPKRNVSYAIIPLEKMTPYAASDGHYTWTLYKKKLPKISEDQDLTDLFLIESQLMWVLLSCEHNGVFVDREYLDKAGPILEEEKITIENKIRKELGEVNPGSNAALIPLLESKGVKFHKKTKTGRPSLDREVLERLATKHQVCADIKDFRAVTKLKSTYVDGICDKLDDEDRLHCEYNQMVSTGRMSSKKPNLQNIPAKDKTIRKAFVPPKSVICTECGHEDKFILDVSSCPKCMGPVETQDDYVLIYIDYSQMEVRMTAHYSEDPILLEVYNKTHQDVHTRTMCELFDIDYDEAVKILEDETHPRHEELTTLRKISKMTNFLIIYGGSAKTLSARLSTPQKQYSERQCKKFIDLYFDRLRGVRRWINKTKIYVRDTGHVQNYFGRYRRFPELKDRKFAWAKRWEVERAERQAVNYLIQGTCADVFKIAMVRAYDVLRDTRSKCVMPIHDEIVFYFHQDELGYLKDIVKQMEDFDFLVPMTVDICYSKTTWAEKKSLKL